MDEFKLIVAGGREFTDYQRAQLEINYIINNQLKDYSVSIVSGMARGADALAVFYAKEFGHKLYEFPVTASDWRLRGKAAGHIRNRQMGDFADGLLAFWDGKSPGTKGMIDYMKSLAKPVRIIRY